MEFEMDILLLGDVLCVTHTPSALSTIIWRLSYVDRRFLRNFIHERKAMCENRIKYFEPNEYNICQHRTFSLRYIDSRKGRGVVAERDIPKNTVIALFPGAETARIPEHSSLPASEYGRDDSELLDREQDTLPLSDYAITTTVLDLDAAEEATGYHYRILDPVADDTDGAADQLAHLWDQYRALDHWWPNEPESLPEHMVTLTEIKAQMLYERLKQTFETLRHAPHVPNMKVYEFIIDPRQSFGGWIMIHVNERLHFVCEQAKLRTAQESARWNIQLALNSEFDVKRNRRRLIAAKAKSLKMSDAYPHMGAFVNKPYATERPNAVFTDPKDWIPLISRRTPSHPAEGRLVHETQSPMTPDRLRHLQRQALITSRPIVRGEEILIDYYRDSSV